MTSTTTVTVLFTDVVGNTALRQRLGDAAAERALQEHDKLVRDQIGPCGGREVKTIGDSFMVAFDSARKAVDCAIAIQRALADWNNAVGAPLAAPPGGASPSPTDAGPIQVRIGINTGEATEEKGDLSGTAVNAAKYIEGKAQPDQVLVSETVRALIGPVKDLTFADRGRFRLKGFPERWRLYEVVWREEAAVAPAHLERTPFVGREEERATLRGLLERAQHGHGALAMIGGEPGVGKTRLAEELMAEARQKGMAALIGHCYEMEGAPPYIPFVEVIESAVRAIPSAALHEALGDAAPEVAKLLPELRRIIPDIPSPLELPPEQERHFLFNNLRAFLARAAAARPLLLVLDDLHWADDATLLLLEHIAHALHEMPVLILGTYRDVELDVARPLARTLEDLVRQRLAHDLALRRLPEAGVAAVLRGLSGREPPPALVQVIYGETEGNPFFVEEVFKHLAEEGRLFDPSGKDWRTGLHVGELDVPRGVRLVIGRRLERVCEDCRRVLTAAAVIGRAFTFELLQTLADMGEEALLDAVDEAERAHLITSGEGREARFTFAHELIRQTLLGAMSLPRRQRMHLRVAEALEKTYAATSEEHASDIAHHLYQAGAAADPERTVRYLTLAGDQAMAAAAFEDALRLFENALSLHPEGDRRGRADLLFKRGLALRSMGRWEEALADWMQSLASYEAEGDKDAVGDVSYEISWQLGWANRFTEAAEIANRGLAAIGEQPSAKHCRLLGEAGENHALGGDFEGGGRMIGQSVALAERLGDDAVLGEALVQDAALGWYFMQVRRQLESARRAAEHLRQAGNRWYLVDALRYTLFALLCLGRLREAGNVGREAEELSSRLGHYGALIAARTGNSWTKLLLSGDIEQFQNGAAELVALSVSVGYGWTSSYYSQLGYAHFWRGRWPEAIEHHEQAARLEPEGYLAGYDWSALFLARAYTGDRAGALALLEDKKEGIARAGRANTTGEWFALLSVVEGLAVLGERDEAARLYPVTLEANDTGTVVLATRLTQIVAAIAAACGQQWERAEEHFETALRQAREIPVVIAQPETRRWYAWMLLDRAAPGDREKARALLTEAIAMYRNIGMPKHVEMVEELLAKAGGA